MSKTFDINRFMRGLGESTEQVAWYTDEFLQVELHGGFAITPRQQQSPYNQWTGVSVFEHNGDEEATLDAAAEYLNGLPVPEKLVIDGRYGSRTVWKPAFLIKKFRDTYLDRDVSDWSSTSPRWEVRYEARMRYYQNDNQVWVRLNEGEEHELSVWIDPNWAMISESFNLLEPQDWGKKYWVHLKKKEDATFDRTKPELQHDGNSEEFTRDDGTMGRRAKRYDVLMAKFDTEEELIEYMKKLGVEAVKQGSTQKEADIPITDELADWLEAEGISEDSWYKEDMYDVRGLILDTVPDAKNMKKKKLQKALAGVQDDLNGIPMDTLVTLAKADLTPF